MRKSLLLSFCFVPIGLFGQDKTVRLETVSVTSNRLLQQNNETGRSITVLEGKLFEKLPVRSLDELLKYIPGVEIQSRGPLGAQSDIIIRGGTYQQVLVLLDGVKMNDPLTGHFNGNIPVAPYEIARIEVLRGAAAAPYGAEAVGGVIHILTKTFQNLSDSNSTHGQVKLSGGQYQLFTTDAGLSIKTPKVQALVGLLSNHTQGQLLRSQNRGFLHSNTLGASLSTKLRNNWRLSIRSSMDYRDFAAQNFYTSFLSETATEKVSLFWHQVQLRQDKKHGGQQWDFVYKNTLDQYLYNASSTANVNHSEYSLLQYLRHHSINRQFQYSAGAQASVRGLRSNDRGNHQTAQVAAFSSLVYHVKNLNASASLRAEYDQNYGFALLPQMSAAYYFKGVNFRAMAGKALRSADFTERYNNYNKSYVKAGSIGNPNLTAEHSWSYELGASGSITKYVTWSTSLFMRTQNQLIDWVNTPYIDMPRKTNLDTGSTYALAQNVKDVKTKGLELILSAHAFKQGYHSLWAQTGITLLNSSSSDPKPSYYIIAHAKFLFQGSIIYQYRSWQCSINGVYKERNPIVSSSNVSPISSSYFLVNAMLSYQYRKHWSAHVQCNNVGNIYYADLLGAKMPNRWLSLGFGYSF